MQNIYGKFFCDMSNEIAIGATCPLCSGSAKYIWLPPLTDIVNLNNNNDAGNRHIFLPQKFVLRACKFTTDFPFTYRNDGCKVHIIKLTCVQSPTL